MKLQTKELKEKMSLLKPVFSKSDLSGFGEYVFLRKGKIFGMSRNVKIFINFPDITNENLIILPNQELLAFTNKLKTKEIELIDEGQHILLVSGKTKITFVKLDLFFDELDVENNEYKWMNLPEKFFDALQLCSFSTMKGGDSVLTNIFVKNDFVVSSDNFRISLYDLKESIPTEMLLPIESVSEILKYDNIVKYSMDSSYVYFTDKEENLVYSFRLGFGDFHEFGEYFDDIEGQIKIELNSDILWNNEIVSVFTNNDIDNEKSIKVEIKDKKIKFIGENKKGIIESIANIDIEQDIEFIINPLFLSQVAKICKTMVIKDGMAIFTSENFKHLFNLSEMEK